MLLFAVGAKLYSYHGVCKCEGLVGGASYVLVER